jgi:hypothetical protein
MKLVSVLERLVIAAFAMLDWRLGKGRRQP